MMDNYKLKLTRLQNEIFRLLSIKAGDSLNKREIAKFLNVSPTAIAKSLPLLEKEELIKSEKHKNMNLSSIEFNRDSNKAIYFKKLENFKLIYESRLINFLQDSFPGTTIILFGSYARGEDTINSDIDIAVIGTKEKTTNLEKYHKLLEKEIRINFYPSFKEIHKHLKENILNGITLVGGIEL